MKLSELPFPVHPSTKAHLMLPVTIHSSCASILWSFNYGSADFLPTSLPRALFHSIHKCHQYYFRSFCCGSKGVSKGSGFKALTVTYVEDFRQEDQACSQANTAEAWASDLSLIYNRITHICSVRCLSWQLLAAQCPGREGDLEGGKSCGSLPRCQPWEKGDHQGAKNLCTGNTQHLGVIFQGFCLISILASFSRPPGMCSVFVALTPCNCCLLQPSVYPYYTLRIKKVLIPFFLIFFAPQWDYPAPTLLPLYSPRNFL